MKKLKGIIRTPPFPEAVGDNVMAEVFGDSLLGWPVLTILRESREVVVDCWFTKLCEITSFGCRI